MAIRLFSTKKLFIKRSIRPLYAQTQATPYAGFLDLTGIGASSIYPGMVAKQVGAKELFGLCTGATDVPFGLFSNYFQVAGLDQNSPDLAETSVWRGGPDATFEILADALDATATWTSTSTANTPVYHSSAAKLTLTQQGSSKAVGRLMEAPSANKIIMTLDLGSSS